MPGLLVGSSAIEARLFAPASTGASFTAVTLMVISREALSAMPSLTVSETVRAAVLGVSLVLMYVIDRSAACHCTSVAVCPAELSDSTPPE